MNKNEKLIRVFEECKEMLDAIGIEYGKVDAVSINTRAKRRWGQCVYKGNGHFTINISSRLISDEVEEIHLITTMIHELLHTCKGTSGHTGKWKSLAEKVNREYGLNIKRCTSAKEKGINEVYTATRKSSGKQYKIVCEDCGHVYTRKTMSKLVKHPEWYRCGKCGGVLHNGRRAIADSVEEVTIEI